MLTREFLVAAREAALDATRAGPPAAPSSPFFGVGPISDGSTDEVDRRLRRLAFERWLTATYRKRDDRGRDIGGFTAAELARSMHRGEPADSILIDMMRTIHRYFGLPVQNRLAVGLGGGHSGFTVAIQHMMTLSDPAQQVYVDTPRPEGGSNGQAGFFRQSWATQIVDLCRLARNGTTERLHFAAGEGTIPPAAALEEMGIRLFVGVGHETTGASAYSAAEVAGLLQWLDGDPENRHAIIDATSLLGAMPWPRELVDGLVAKCCLFMPLQKAIGGVAGYFTASFTPQALALIDRNMQEPCWAIPRQLSLAVPADAARPLTSPRSVERGPFYDAAQDRMLGGVINTYSLLAFAETTFGLKEIERTIGPAEALDARSTANRAAVEAWTEANPLLKLVVADPEKRGAAVTLLRVDDPEIAPLHGRILARAKQLLGHEGLTHPDGTREPGLGAALYLNAFPSMPGDFRAWIGGVRDTGDILLLLENLRYAWLRAKVLVIGEELAPDVTADTATAEAEIGDDTAALAAFAAGCEELAAILPGLLAIAPGPARAAAAARNAGAIRELLARQRELLPALEAVLETDPTR
jgi:phosphoserine aminotransferase